MLQNETPQATQNTTAVVSPELSEVEGLANDLKHLLVRSEQELIQGDVREHVEKLERWVESYRRGLVAAQKISHNGPDLLQKARKQLKCALEEQLRLEDEGGNPPSKTQASEIENLTKALRRIDKFIPVVEQSFQVKVAEPEPA